MLCNFFQRSADLKQSVNNARNVEIDSAASSGVQWICIKIFSASLGLSLRQHCQFLTLSIVVKNISLEGFDENKRDCHQCRIISFLIMFILKKMPFPSSIECDTTSRLCAISVRDDKDCCICLLIFPFIY